MQKFALIAILLGITIFSHAQKGTIRGRVFNEKNNEPLELATIQIQETTTGTTSDSLGNFTFTGVEAGFVRLVVSYVGFRTTLSPEIQVQGNQTAFIDIAVPESSVLINAVVVTPKVDLKRIESPLSLLTVGVKDIEKAAGANRDVSKIIQTLPGVAATDPNRNDLIVRGGGPSENVFYLDGIELPVINHFATQGSSGGAVGVVNPDFVRQIDFYTGTFPANRPNALSSVMEIRQKDGSQDRIHTKLSVGASDAALTIDGPIGKRSTFIVSARQSYLQLLFKLIGLPFLPTYNDFQLKYKYRIDPKNELSFIGIGAIDNMTLNTALQDKGTEAQRYVLGYLPVYRQWNYAVGAVYKHFAENYHDTWVLSRNMLRNNNFKYPDNDDTQPRLSDYTSDEAENKLRFERTYSGLPFRLLAGAGLQYAHYTNQTYRKRFIDGNASELRYASDLDLFGYQIFAQASDTYFDEKLSLSIGVSSIGNNFNRNMQNPIGQLSPRISASYKLDNRWTVNANIGRYAMRPAYTTLGYKNGDGEYVNRNEMLKHILSDQAIAGMEYLPSGKMRFSLESFYKHYRHYPLSVSEGVSIASKGTDYGQIGDEEIVSTGKGRAYGVEFSGKLIDWNRLNTTVTYTFFRSEFTDKNGTYRPSGWDTRHMVNVISSYRLPKNWHLAMRWRMVGGAPYSPIDSDLSTNKEAWAITRQVYIDYNKFNSLRLRRSHQLDVRIDKEFYFDKWVLNVYTDIQNVYNFQSQNPPIYTNKDANGEVMDDPADPEQKQLLRQIESYSGTILPTIGIIVKI